MDAYVAALEAKLAEVSGIQVDQIKKNQVIFLSNHLKETFFLLKKE